MKKIGQPSTGQPLDVDYISSMINTIDAIVDEINKDNVTTTAYSLEDGANGNSTGQLKIFSKRIAYTIAPGSSAITIPNVNFSNMAFSYSPVVSITVENANTSNILAVVKSVSTTSATIDITTPGSTSGTSGHIHAMVIGYSVV